MKFKVEPREHTFQTIKWLTRKWNIRILE